jgi:hypothetical protein
LSTLHHRKRDQKPPTMKWILGTHALPRSTPVTFERRTGCAWAVNNDKPFLFCDLPVRKNSAYCPHHAGKMVLT